MNHFTVIEIWGQMGSVAKGVVIILVIMSMYVLGIITAFQSMAGGDGGGGLATVSAGISEALLTTAVGLAVAIISVWFYNFFVTKVDDITVDIDETAGEVLDGMMRAGRTVGV